MTSKKRERPNVPVAFRKVETAAELPYALPELDKHMEFLTMNALWDACVPGAHFWFVKASQMQPAVVAGPFVVVQTALEGADRFVTLVTPKGKQKKKHLSRLMGWHNINGKVAAFSTRYGAEVYLAHAGTLYTKRQWHVLPLRDEEVDLD